MNRLEPACGECEKAKVPCIRLAGRACERCYEWHRRCSKYVRETRGTQTIMRTGGVIRNGTPEPEEGRNPKRLRTVRTRSQLSKSKLKPSRVTRTTRSGGQRPVKRTQATRTTRSHQPEARQRAKQKKATVRQSAAAVTRQSESIKVNEIKIVGGGCVIIKIIHIDERGKAKTY